MKEDSNLFENLSENRILVLGSNLNLNAEELNSLLQIGFKFIYLINSPKIIEDYIFRLVDSDSLFILNNFAEMNMATKSDICFYGFTPISNDLFAKFKNYNENVLIIFDTEIGGFKTLWSRNFKKLKILETPLAIFIASKNQEVYYTEKIDKQAPEFFTNRGNEIDAFRTFILSTRYRAAKIIGLDGIGKKSFVNYLKTFHNLDQNCFEYFFSKGDNTLYDLINELGKYLSVKINEKEISSIKKDNNSSSVLRLFEKFDKLDGAKIIFRNVNWALDAVTNEFQDKQLGIFFHNLLVRNSYNGNKIYFVSNVDFNFTSFQSDDVCFSIMLPGINSKFIKIIMEREFLQKNNQVLAKRIMQLEDEIIVELINGHPHIAKMFVKACDNASIDTIIKDDNFRKKFENDKVDYLFNIITLDSNQKSVEYLNYLACVNGKFEKQLIDELCDKDNVNAINYLRNHFFLEIEHHENKSESYEVPILIRKLVQSKLNKNNYKTINNYLGNFFWQTANDFSTSTIKMIKAYRNAEFHFVASENTEMLKKLIALFKEKYLIRANQLYEMHKYKEAYFLYKELDKNNYILDNKNANFFIVCCSKIDAEDAVKFMLKVHNNYPESKFITNTIANYYYEHAEFEQALTFVSKSIQIQQEDYVAQALYYNILSKIGREQEAFDYYNQKLVANINHKLQDDSKQQIVRDLMNYFQILRCNKFVGELMEKLIESIPKVEQGLIKNYLNSSINSSNAEKITSAFAVAMNSKYADVPLKDAHLNYINRQKNTTIIPKEELIEFKAKYSEQLNSSFSSLLDQARQRVNKSLEIIKKVNIIDNQNPIAKLALPVILLNHYNIELISKLITENDLFYSKTKIVFTSANPVNENTLRLDREFRIIDNLLQSSKERDKFELISKWAIRLSDFTRIMLELNPNVIHFSGHGNQSGLAFENENGKLEMIGIDSLDQLFSNFSGIVHCVLLNSCYSENIAKVISSHNIYVIGMKSEIGDNIAKRFSTGFYQALATGKSIEDSFRMGIIHISNLDEAQGIPKLWNNGIQIEF